MFWFNTITRGDLHLSSTVPGTYCVTVRAYSSYETMGPDNKRGPKVKEACYWGSMHININGTVVYNNAATSSLIAAIAARRAMKVKSFS